MLTGAGSPVVVVLGLLAGLWAVARLRGVPITDAPPSGTTSVVVPARDEERSLPRLLRSLDPLPPGTEVIVVDDGSTDGTAEVALAHGARLVSAPPPPAGWLGKPWACWLGARAATGDRLVFLDADTELAPGALRSLATAHERHAAGGLLSVQPFHRAERAYEQASAIPNVVSTMGSGCFSASPSGDRAVAFGPCLVTTAAAYHAVGGHGAVAGEVIEDIHLARAYRAADRPVCGFVGGPLVRFRMYPDGVGQLLEGWTKNLSGGFRLAPAAPTVAAALWVTAGLAIALAALDAALALVAGDTASWWPAAAWVAYGAHLRWLLRRLGSFRWWAAWLFPVTLAAFVALFVRSAVHRMVRHRVSWRGRTIALGRVGT